MATWKAIRDQIHEFTETKIQEHETTGNQLRDYSEMYLKKQKSDEASGIINTSFNRDRLQSNMLTLSLAGTNTTASSMRWILKMLVKYPNIQKKLQEEIDAVIGFERVPTYCDRFNMPYTEAFLLETQRYSSLIPFSLPHASQADTKISGYDIPAGVTILPMFFMVHNDPQIWGDPENFRPERFLDANTSLIKSDFWIPFGMGKRSCLGENLARTEIFIFLTNLLQHFTFFAPSKEDLDTEIIGTILSRELLEFKITAQYRPITT